MNKHIWNINDIKMGFDRFLKENCRLPIAPEIDKLDYLPSSRQIQRRFGGLEQIRKKLGYAEHHFGKGKFRSKIAKRAGVVGLSAEKTVERLLIDKFGEPFVHTEKRFGEHKERVDFFIYCKPYFFGVDVLYPGSFRDLQKNINIKIDRYKTFPYVLIFLVANESYSQDKIDNWIKNKRKDLPVNSKVYSLQAFKECLQGFEPYLNPIKLK